MSSALTVRPRVVRASRHRFASVLGTIAVAGALTGPLGAGGTAAAALPRCPTLSTWHVRPVSAPVRAALTTYYVARHLAPVTVRANRMWVLGLALERVGTHWCLNAGGGRAGYVGVVPRNANAAVLVQVTHRAYPVTGAATTWATVVRTGARWRVVGDDTAP